MIFEQDRGKFLTAGLSRQADFRQRYFKQEDVIRSDSATINPWGTGSDDALHHRKAAL